MQLAKHGSASVGDKIPHVAHDLPYSRPDAFFKRRLALKTCAATAFLVDLIDANIDALAAAWFCWTLFDGHWSDTRTVVVAQVSRNV